MRTSQSWKQPSRQTVMKGCRGMLVFSVSLLLLALASAVATSKRSDRNGLATTVTRIGNAHSGSGNLVPVF